jgi:hypothetical protein
MSEFKAKDIFRASGLSLLSISNSHVKTDQKKIKSGRAVSPLLLIRDTANGKVVLDTKLGDYGTRQRLSRKYEELRLDKRGLCPTCSEVCGEGEDIAKRV